MTGQPLIMGIRMPILGWHAVLSRGLMRALDNLPDQVDLFPRVVAHRERFGADLALAGAGSLPVPRERHADLFPLAALLITYPEKPQPVLRTLTWLVLEAHLIGGHEDLIVQLTQVIRGAIVRSSSKLLYTIAECGGLRHLLAKMHRLRLQSPELGVTGHGAFDRLWDKQLMAFCHALVGAPDRLAAALDARDDESADPGYVLPALTVEPVADEPDESPIYLTRPISLDEPIPPAPLRRALGWSEFMSRRSSPDLIRRAEGVCPADLRELEWGSALVGAQRALADGDLDQVERRAVRLLSIEAGITTREALSIGIGAACTGEGPVIDLEAQALRRPEIMPVDCFLPERDDRRWLPTGGDIIFPLSAALVDVVRGLLEARAKLDGRPPDSLLVGGRLDPSHDDATGLVSRIRSAISSVHRLCLASAVAEAMGIDAAQKAFGDSFGLSSAPTYYGAYPGQEVARTLAAANRFVGHDLTSAPWLAASAHVFGSRARPAEPPYRHVWERLSGSPGRARGRPAAADAVADWRRRRDRLVIHLLLATGHRPTAAMAEVTLHDFLPELALVVVGDKQSDPAHATRLVCTGWRFVGELEGFVRELQRMARRSDQPRMRTLANEILKGAAPIFTVPTMADHESLDVRGLLQELDALWGERPNLHRHGLCQYLIARQVDPEWRYWQMGWLCHDHHATSASAPYPPMQLGLNLAPIVDDWLAHCGWAGGCEPTDAMGIVPPLPLVDWTVRRERQRAGVEQALTTMSADFAQARRALRDTVWQTIAGHARKVLPDFDAAGTGADPVFAPLVCPLPERSAIIGRPAVDALLAPFQARGTDAVTWMVAVRLIRTALLKTAARHRVRIHLPSEPQLLRTQVPSPFLRGCGLALAQIEALRAGLVERAARLPKAVAGDGLVDLIGLTVITMICHGPCPDVETAIGVLASADDVRHANAEPGWLRLPAGNGHLILTGDPAVLVCRVMRCRDWRSALEELRKRPKQVLEQLVARAAPSLVPERTSVLLERLVQTAAVAKTLRLNGAERLVAEGAVRPALVTAERPAAVADGITTQGAGRVDVDVDVDASEDSASVPRTAPPHRPNRDIAKTMRAFDPDYTGNILGVPAEPPARRQGQLRRLLGHALAEVGVEPTPARVLLEYAHHLLTVGGPRSRGGQRASTIYKVYHRLAPIVGLIDRDRSLETVSVEEMTAVCQAACAQAHRRQSADVLGELRRFLEHMALRYHVPMPDWGMLYRAFGQPVEGGDPAMVGDHEVERVVAHLVAAMRAVEGTDADPAERRFREICLATVLIAEASGARPRSIHGLTLDDVLLGREFDCIRLRSSGRFASIKSATAAGFVPLEGAVWARHAAWFTAWFGRLVCAWSPSALVSIPLFQVPGQPVGTRYELDKVTRAIGELMRWATQHPRGRTYWLRKRRVHARHLRVMATPGAMARDMAQAMRADGHALIVTPLSSYLGDPGAFMTPGLGAHRVTTRQGAIAISGSLPVRVDRVAKATADDAAARVGQLLRLDRAAFDAVALPEPPFLSHYAAALTWVSLERVVADLCRGEHADRVIDRRGIDRDQLASIQRALQAVSARLKVSAGIGGGMLGPPRAMTVAHGWGALLAAQDERLRTVARHWVAVAAPSSLAHGCELHDAEAIAAFRAMAADVCPQLELVESPGGFGTRVLAFRGARSRQAYGVWPVLRWILAVVWIADHRA